MNQQQNKNNIKHKIKLKKHFYGLLYDISP
jgi:hypothetical protein